MKYCLKIIVLLPLIFLSAAVTVQADVIYTVKKGDTLKKIASVYFPLTASYTKDELVQDIFRVNNMTSQHLSIGQELIIPVVRDEPIRPVRVKRPVGYEAKGVYINQWNAGTRKVFDVAEKLECCGANTIVFDAKDVKGGLSYRSCIPGRFAGIRSYPYAIEDISKLVEYLHDMDIHVVARVSVCKDILIAGAMHHWRLADDWLDPANVEVREYTLAVIKELTELGIDEIQLDYFRYPADSKTDTGIQGKTRSDIMAEFLSQIYALTSSKGVLLSLDMFGIVIWQHPQDIAVVGQDVIKMKPYLDVISPMLYPSHFSKGFAGVKNPADEPYMFVSRGVIRLKALLNDDVIIRPWLQAFPLRVSIGYGPGFIETQIIAADNSGGRGWLLWSPGNYYDDSYEAIKNLKHRSIQNSDLAETVTTSGTVGPDPPACLPVDKD